MIRPHYVGVYQSICTSERMASLANDTSRLFFLQLLTHCDSFGRTEGSPATLTALVWPLLGRTPAQTEKVLVDLARAGLVRRYEAGGKRYLQVEQWERFGAKVGRPDRRGDGLWPAPPEPDCGNTPADGGVVPPRARVGSDRNGSDRIGSEDGETEGKDPPPKVEVETWAKVFAEFEQFDTPEIRSGYRDLVKMRKRMRYGEWQPETLRKNLRHAVEYGPAALLAAFEESTRLEYQGLFPQKHAKRGAQGQPTGLAAVASMMRGGS